MGYEVYLQRFCHGEAADAANGEAVWDLLRGAWDVPPDESGYCRVTRGDGEADLYGAREGGRIEGLMFARPGGGVGIFDLMVEVARSGDMVILPLDVAPCVVRDRQLSHLPPDLLSESPPPVLVSNGGDLHSVITGSTT